MAPAAVPTAVREGTMETHDDTTSFLEHRAHLRDHLDRVRATGRPLFVTNGRNPLLWRVA